MCKVILSKTQSMEMQKLTPELTPFNDVIDWFLFLKLHKEILNGML